MPCPPLLENISWTKSLMTFGPSPTTYESETWRWLQRCGSAVATFLYLEHTCIIAQIFSGYSREIWTGEQLQHLKIFDQISGGNFLWDRGATPDRKPAIRETMFGRRSWMLLSASWSRKNSASKAMSSSTASVRSSCAMSLSAPDRISLDGKTCSSKMDYVWWREM